MADMGGEMAKAPAKAPAKAQTPPQRRRKYGLNENYARELMELHTLGVDGGYNAAGCYRGRACVDRLGCGALWQWAKKYRKTNANGNKNNILQGDFVFRKSWHGR